jgi:flagellar biosynthesis/type III secretory pathway protein FliH
MVLAALLTEQKLRKAREQGIEQGREQGREEGIEQGRQEVRALWEAWNRRRLEAKAKGEAFTEPPPTNGHHNGTQ